MVKLAGVSEDIFYAMDRIRETALIRFDSLFSPESKLWTLELLRHFHRLFVGQWDKGAGSFLEKLHHQLDGSTDDVVQLAAELLYVQQFFTSVTGPDKKLENVRTVLSWCQRPPFIPDWAVKGAQHGFSRDQSFNQHRPHHLAWLTEFLIHWHELPDAKRTELLGDAWLFAQEARTVEFSEGAFQPMQEAWLYILFPDTFENISSRADKRRIRDAFSKRLPFSPTQNIDKDLFEIRNQLNAEQGQGFHFYRTPLIEQWRGSSTIDSNLVQIAAGDISLIRQSRSHERYADFSPEEKLAHHRVHEALERLGQIVVTELGGERDYVLKRTSGFHPASGVRGGKPKDLWFGVYRKVNEDRFLGNPQVFMIVSGRGIEYGFSPLTHPDDFSNQALKKRTREIAKAVLEQLPAPGSPESAELGVRLAGSGNWHFRRKQRLDPNQSEFESLDKWLEYLHSEEGVRNAGGGITQYILDDEIDTVDLGVRTRQMAQVFRPLMQDIVADGVPTRASAIANQASPTALTEGMAQPPFSELLHNFLNEFAKARREPFQKVASLWSSMAALKARLEQFPAVRSRRELLVNISVGQGNWASVPWIALLNTRITKSTQEGVYVVYLISTDLERVFLTLNQGTTILVRELGQREAQKRMLDVANKARRFIEELRPAGFNLDNDINLGGDSWLAKNYEVGTIAHFDFNANETPDDNRMNELLAAALDAYDRAVDAPAPLTDSATTDAARPEASSTFPPYNIEDALSELFLEQASLERLLVIWSAKRNLILQGAPGVGKSFVAKRLAYLLLGEKDSSRVETVQFHQSYSYEDFVQGYRRIIETEICPLLEEYWFDDPDTAEHWRQELLQGTP